MSIMSKKDKGMSAELNEQQVAAAGKPRRFMNLVVPNQNRIFAYILHAVANRADAEDILQDTLAVMWEKFESYEADSDFVSWGITIAKFKIFNFRKKRKPTLSDEVVEILGRETGEMFNTLDEQLDTLNQCIKKLPDKEKVLLKMRYEQDLTFEKIASRFSVTVSGVCRAVSRTHLKLIRCLTKNQDLVQ